MQVLMGMDPDKMVIVLPTGLLAIYAVVMIQKTLSNKNSKYPGLIIPVLCFVTSTVLAIRPMLVTQPGTLDGLGLYCLRMWLTFNITTVVFAFAYIITRKKKTALEKELARMAAEEEPTEEFLSESDES